MRFIIYRDNERQWRWRLRARNGNIVADSGEGYVRKSAAVKAAVRIRTEAPDADIDIAK